MDAFVPPLRDLRKRAGLSQAQLAQRLDVDTSLISRWEKGERQPSPDQLLEFARAVGVTLDFLLNAEVNPRFQFRARAGASAQETAELTRVETDAAQQIHFLDAAHKLAKEPARASSLVFDAGNVTDADMADFADEVRGLLRLNRVTALDELKEAMAEQHIHVFEWNLPWVVSGLSYRGPFTVVFINHNHTRERRLFTLAHELAHVLLHLRRDARETIASTFGGRDPDEKQANAFAAELLMPAPAIDKLVQTLGNRLRETPMLEGAARSFNVSRDALFYRLAARGVFDWAEKKRYFTETTPPEVPDTPRVADVDAQVSTSFVQLALSLYDAGQVSAGKLSEWFFTSRPAIEDYLTERYLETDAVLF